MDLDFRKGEEVHQGNWIYPKLLEELQFAKGEGCFQRGRNWEQRNAKYEGFGEGGQKNRGLLASEQVQ